MRIKTILLVFINTGLLLSQWHVQNSTTNQLYDVHFINQELGWAIGNNATIIKTDDGGTTWHHVGPSISNAYYRHIHFHDALHGIVGGRQDTSIAGRHTERSLILYTEDGGWNWHEAALPFDWGWPLTDIKFVNKNIGWASMGNFWVWPQQNKILRTEDGGLTWETIFEQDTLIAKSICFRDEKHGYSANSFCGDVFGEAVIRRTDDAGKTWQYAGVVSSPVFDMAVSADDHITAIGYFKIFTSLNGGKTWMSTGHSLQRDWIQPSDIQILKGGEIYMSAYQIQENNRKAMIYFSDNDGESWRILYEYPNVKFRGIHILPHEGSLTFMKHDACWAVGTEGLIVNSPDIYYPSAQNTDHTIRIEQNFPNPFTPAQGTQILIQSKMDQIITMSLYNMMGQKIKTIFSELLPQGLHMGMIEASDLLKDNLPLASGVYILELKSATDRQAIKINIVH